MKIYIRDDFSTHYKELYSLKMMRQDPYFNGTSPISRRLVRTFGNVTGPFDAAAPGSSFSTVDE